MSIGTKSTSVSLIGWRIGPPVCYVPLRLLGDFSDPSTGYSLVLKYYFGRIQLLMSRIATLISELHPTNRPIADYFMTDWTSTYVTDGFLAGVHKAVQNVDQDDELFGRFKEYVLEEEAKMKEKLQTVMYCIDATNTLDLVINSSRLETVCTVVTNEKRQLKFY